MEAKGSGTSEYRGLPGRTAVPPPGWRAVRARGDAPGPRTPGEKARDVVLGRRTPRSSRSGSIAVLSSPSLAAAESTGVARCRAPAAVILERVTVCSPAWYILSGGLWRW